MSSLLLVVLTSDRYFGFRESVLLRQVVVQLQDQVPDLLQLLFRQHEATFPAEPVTIFLDPVDSDVCRRIG